ncbi:hypothetical protein EJ110_NYTH54125 [Nymphaea thermarum]|nr:hypothetical protein EJ110_NYTH54125 [Nymphaea thermarum]
MKMLSRVESSRRSVSNAGPSTISEIYTTLIEHEIESSDENKEVSFPDIQGWISKGYKFVHLGQIDVLVKPHFKYELNAPYLISLLDVRHVDWKQALICQFIEELSKDGLCCVQPNFTLSLQDPHLLQAFVLCVQIKEVNLVAKSVYATITSRCTFNLLQSTLTSFKLDYGINFPLSMNKNIMQPQIHCCQIFSGQGRTMQGELKELDPVDHNLPNTSRDSCPMKASVKSTNVQIKAQDRMTSR